MSNKLEYLGRYAFYECDTLKEISIPNGIISIEMYSFYGCESLIKASIPDNVKNLGTNAFQKCDVLTDVTLGKGITKISSYAFADCAELKSIVIPYNVTTIDSNAFTNDPKLTEITIPQKTTTISSTAFSYPGRMTVYGVGGSYAETYANAQGMSFVDKSVPATAVELDESTYTLVRGTNITLQPKITPADYTDLITYKSSDTDIATVDANGKISAVSVGTTTIKVIVGSVSVNCKVTVVQPVTSIYIDQYSIEMDGGDTCQLNATVYPDNAYNKEVTWRSSDSNIATVDEKGLVTAIGKGECRIYAEAKDGSGRNNYCYVAVLNNVHSVSSVNAFESSHPYGNNCNDIWQYSVPNADCLSVTFDDRTCIEDGFDYIYIYDVDKNKIGEYTGIELAGRTIEVPGNTVKIKLISDNVGTEWGFKIVGISTSTCSHDNTEVQNAREATCEEDGYTGDVVCKRCQKIITVGQVIEKTGHDYQNPVFTWANDGKNCTVSYTCGNDINHFVQHSCTILSQVKIPATCSTKGTTTYTASYGNDSSTKDVQDIPTITHVDSNNDGKCDTCNYVIHTHIGTKVEQVEATCTSYGVKEYYKCTCGKVFTDLGCENEITDFQAWQFEEGKIEKKAHTLELITTSATTSRNGKKESKCSVCGEVTNSTTIYALKTVRLSTTKYTYDGKLKKPTLIIKDSSGNIVSNSNYMVTYPKGRINVGSYTVKVTFKGDYSGSKNLTFKINPKATTVRKVVVASRKLTVTLKKQATQSTGYEVQVATNNKFTKNLKTTTITKNSKTSVSINSLKGNTPYYVRVRTYKKVGRKKFYSDWKVYSKKVKTKK